MIRCKIRGQISANLDSYEELMAVFSGDGVEGEQRKAVDAAGGVIFEDVTLEEIGENHFRLQITDSAGTALLTHEFVIRYDPVSTETSSVVGVLPRTLLVETSDGMIAIADAGVPLPALCAQTFIRQNNNPNITLKLFQDRAPIGEIRVENIPSEGGMGSLVELSLEVNERGQILGEATICAQSGENCTFHPRVDSYKAAGQYHQKKLWENRFTLIRAQWESEAAAENQSQNVVVSEVIKKIKYIEKLFSQVPLDRQEIVVALDELKALVAPPKDDMAANHDGFYQDSGGLPRCHLRISAFLYSRRKKRNKRKVILYRYRE